MLRKIAFLTAPLLAISVAQAETFTVPAEVPFADGIDVTTAVKTECALPTRLPQFIAEGAKEAAAGVDVVIGDTTTDNAPGKVLRLEYTKIIGYGGGIWSGKKSVTVTGELYENGKLVGNFLALRYSGGGAFGAYKGTCSILGRCIKTLGADIAHWLQKPTMDARLGDA